MSTRFELGLAGSSDTQPVSVTNPVPVSQTTAGAVISATNPLPTQPLRDSAVPLIAGSGNVANGSAAATLTGLSTDTVYLAGFEITGSGATAGLPVTVTVAGLLGGSRLYTYVFAVGALVGNFPLIVDFDPPIPASAVNTPISVTCPAGGAGNTNNTVVAHGFHR